MDRISRTALMTSALVVGGSAGAVPVTMSQRIDLGSALNAGEALSGTFDIRSLLVDDQGRPVEIDLSSARLTAFAYSDAAVSYSQSATGYYNNGGFYFTYYVQQQGVYYYYYSYRCGWLSTCYAQAAAYYYYYAPAGGYAANLQRDLTTTAADNVVDRGQVAIGDQSTATSVQTRQSGPTVTGYGSDGSNQYSNAYIEYRQTRYIEQSSIADGPLDFVMDLNEANLLDLESDGLLNFAFNMLVGRSTLSWIQLDVAGEQLAFVEPETPSDVPEPGTVALLGLGVLALGAGRRARDRRQKAA